MSFVGGGTDLPSFYRDHGGAVLSTAIDRYVYVSVNSKFGGGIRLAYSETEEVDRLEEIKHRLFRAVFECLDLKGGVEVTTTADIPSKGTGLGSSSSFTVGLLHVMSAYLGRYVSSEDLARLACEVELDRCGEPIGKQDQYAAAFGGINLIEFRSDDSVNVQPVVMSSEVKTAFERSIISFYTGRTRSASKILETQSRAVGESGPVRDSLKRMTQLAYVMRNALSGGTLDDVGAILQENWALKKQLSAGISDDQIDAWHRAGVEAGASGGKLLGAGASGFMMFVAPEDRHDAIARAVGLPVVDLRLEPLGSRILFYHPPR